MQNRDFDMQNRDFDVKNKDFFSTETELFSKLGKGGVGNNFIKKKNVHHVDEV